jgi:hypothetical protein
MAEVPFAGIDGLAPWHFEITSTGQGHSIRKLQVQSPLLINGQPVTTAKLVDGDVITAGSLVLIYGSEVFENLEVPLNMATSPDGDEFVSRLVDAPVGTTHLHPREMPEAPSLLAAVIAALVALLVTIIAYSFICNFRWPFFICGTLALGHAVGRMFRLAGDGHDMRFGQFAALAVVVGVVSVNSLTVAGIMNMYETVNESPMTSEGSLIGGAPTSPEAEQSTLGTGQAALDVTSGSLVEIWQKLIPWNSISGKNARLIPLTGFNPIMFGPKSLVACLLMMITAYRAAFNSRPKTTVSTVAAAT